MVRPLHTPAHSFPGSDGRSSPLRIPPDQTKAPKEAGAAARDPPRRRPRTRAPEVPLQRDEACRKFSILDLNFGTVQDLRSASGPTPASDTPPRLCSSHIHSRDTRPTSAQLRHSFAAGRLGLLSRSA